ncbi:MAG TPA: 2-dehydropantoate 2-reductase [Chloroflexota bacterium]|nr:2-dehydropantoate 2-reductase [Chloroflexota bacterium]
MRVTIVGAGAIGGLAGAWMTMAGENVELVDRWEEHVRAMQRDGLFIDGLRGEHRVKVKALTPAELEGPLEMVFVSCKSHDTRSVIELIKPFLTENSTVVSFQNGMNEELIGSIIGPEMVLGGIPDYGGALVDPGHLEFVHPGVAYVGEMDGSITNRAREAQRLLNHHVETELTTNIIGRLWAKQCHMTQVVMTALVDAPINQVLRDEKVRHLGVSIIAEAIRVSDAAGVTLPESGSVGQTIQPTRCRSGTPEDTRRLVDDLGIWVESSHRHQEEQEAAGTHRYVKKASGMWWDIYYRKRASETKGISGALIEQADALGVAVPLNKKTVELVYELEEGKRASGTQNLDELYAYAQENGLLLPMGPLLTEQVPAT